MDKTYKCVVCGKPDDLSKYKPPNPYLDLMQSRHICLHCAFWTYRKENPEADCEIIDGKYYVLPANTKATKTIDRIGRKELAIMHPDMTVKMSNQTRYIGPVPQHFLRFFPDTAKVLSKKIFRSLEFDLDPCFAKGCWDRYTCYRYDTSVEPETPWNVIPKNHKAGDEKCPRYININDIPKWK